ncbi:MAG: exodeoxyribonuclease VII large subunit [Planctomycetota bacterium]
MTKATVVPDDPRPDDPWSGGLGAAPQARARVFTVGEITATIRHVLEGLGRVAIEGEISGLRPAASGHVYFNLKDIDAVLACAIWKSRAKTAAPFPLEEGASVIAHGRLDVYGPRGGYTLIVERLEKKGLGALLLELERLKGELRARGWFDRHRPLPSMPRTIGVVTSRDGAAFQDFLRTRSLRWPGYPVRLAHTPVQGPHAAKEIAAAIARLDKSGVDVIVVCRGGGSLEDLWSFNELPVAEAIWNASVPVVSGVGHETDVTLADLVADHRAHTPTDAAQTVLPDRAALVADLDRAATHLGQAIDDILESRQERLDRAAGAACLASASWMLERRAERLEHHASTLRLALARAVMTADARMATIAPRLRHAGDALFRERARRLDLAERTLRATSPENVLARGYSITRRAGTKTPLVSAADLKPGEALETRLFSGVVHSTVEKSAENT